MAMATTRDLQREIEAANNLREQLAAIGDEELTRDMIEGETSLIEMVDAMVKQDGEDAAHVASIKKYSDDLSNRQKRIEDRIEVRRGLLAKAMEIAGRDKIETATGTISLGANPVSAIVTDEAAIPSEFFEQPPPRLNKRALLAALKEKRATGGEIPGATLSNGGCRVTIRRS
jgi:hypothetical protein